MDFILKFLDDSILDKAFSDKVDNYLKENFNEKFQMIKGEVIANTDIKNKYSSRKDTVYVHIIDKKEITKREFGDIAEKILRGINTNGFQLNLLYLDYMHKEDSGYVYSIKFDEGNMTKKDLMPYIETVSKK